MTGIHAAEKVAVVVAVATAAALARRRAEHVPAAVALAIFALADLSWFPLHAILSHYPDRTEPLQGEARLAVYLDGAAVLAQQSYIPALAFSAGAAPGRRMRAAAPVVLSWALASLVLAALYPSPMVRGAGLQRVYLAADLASLFATVVAFVMWAGRRLAPTTSHAVALVLVALDAVLLLSPFSPWRAGLFDGRYDTAQTAIALSFSFLATCQGVLCLWK